MVYAVALLPIIAAAPASGAAAHPTDADLALKVIFLILSAAVGVSVIYANTKRQPALHEAYAGRGDLEDLKAETNARLTGLSAKVADSHKELEHRLDQVATKSGESDGRLHDRVSRLAVEIGELRGKIGGKA